MSARPKQDDPLPTRSSLLRRLKDWRDDQSWQEFHDTYWKLVFAVARKAGLTEAEAQDAVQATMVTVATRMREFKYDPALGSFKNWLLHTARWRIADILRKRGREVGPGPARPDDSARTPTIERVPDPDALNWQAIYDEEWEKNLVDAALARIKRKVKPKQYQLFDLFVIKHWSVAEITSTLGVSVHQVYAARSRVGKALKQEITALETRMF
jgi:RNA polymerase sigma-70 factor (ECF subfamily)